MWVALDRDALVDQYGALEGPVQIGLSIALILVALEMGRRAVKWILPAVAVLALLYGLYGSALPGEFGHPGLPIESFLGTLVISEGGLWGPLTGISVDVVAVFVLLGSIVGAGEATCWQKCLHFTAHLHSKSPDPQLTDTPGAATPPHGGDGGFFSPPIVTFA